MSVSFNDLYGSYLTEVPGIPSVSLSTNINGINVRFVIPQSPQRFRGVF